LILRADKKLQLAELQSQLATTTKVDTASCFSNRI